MSAITRIGVLTGGGDAPGLNAVIRAVVKAACEQRHRNHRHRGQLRRPARAGSLARADAARRHRHPAARRHDPRHAQHAAIRSLAGDDLRRPAATTPIASSRCSRRWSSARWSSIGGDGTLAIAHEFCQLGMPIVGVPKTIDNDIVGTTNCFGFDTAVDVRDRRDRSAAHDGGSAQAHPGRRGDGTLRRLDCAVRRRRRRRRCDPDSGDSVRHRPGRRAAARARQVGREVQHRRRRRRRVPERRHARR